MNRAVRTVIRLVAAGLMVIGGMVIGLEFMRDRVKHAQLSVGQCVLGGLLIVAGVVLFWASSRLAERLADDFEE